MTPPAPHSTPTTGPPTLSLPFSLSAAPPTGRSKRARTPIRSSVTHSSLPPSRAPHLSPPLPAPGPPPLATESPSLLGFWLSAATVRHSPISSSPSSNPRNFLQFPHPLAPPELQDLITLNHDHRSSLPAGERRRPRTLLPPPRRPTARVRATPARLA
jgi:hypothetical protein